jgi:TnpA family transposase
MAKIKTYYIDEIAKLTQAKLERASKVHETVNAYCIFIEGDHYHILLPHYQSEAEEDRRIREILNVLVSNPEACKAFAKIIVPPYRFFERQEKKQKRNLPKS